MLSVNILPSPPGCVYRSYKLCQLRTLPPALILLCALLLQVWRFRPITANYFPSLDEIAVQALRPLVNVFTG
jgi:hypothetical protein